jgi:hypothetical protein
MLSRKDYTRDGLDHATSAVEAELAAHVVVPGTGIPQVVNR